MGPSSFFFSCASCFYVFFFPTNVSCAYAILFVFLNLLLSVFVFIPTCVSYAHTFCFWFFCASWFWFSYTSCFLFFNVYLCFSSCFSYKDLCVRKLGCERVYLFHEVLLCYFIINVVLLSFKWTLFMILFINCMEIVHGLCNYARPYRVVSFSWEAKDINKDLY